MIFDKGLIRYWFEKQATNIGENFLNGSNKLDTNASAEKEDSFTLKEDGASGVHLLKGTEHSLKVKSPAMKTLENFSAQSGPDIGGVGKVDTDASIGKQNPIGLNYNKRTV